MARGQHDSLADHKACAARSSDLIGKSRIGAHAHTFVFTLDAVIVSFCDQRDLSVFGCLYFGVSHDQCGGFRKVLQAMMDPEMRRRYQRLTENGQ